MSRKLSAVTCCLKWLDEHSKGSLIIQCRIDKHNKQNSYMHFQTSTVVWMRRSMLLWDFTQHRVGVSCWCFGNTHQLCSRVKQSISWTASPYGENKLLIKRYNSCRVLAFSTIFLHSRRSWASSDHLVIFIFLKSFLT